jgi:hypothetical protein
VLTADPESVNTPVTTRSGIAYIHLLPGENKTIVWKNAPEPQKMFLLETKAQVNYTYDNGTLTFTVPQQMRTDNVDVVKVIIKK